jgi:hypothetical protein
MRSRREGEGREGKLILYGLQVSDQVSTLGLHGMERNIEAFLDDIKLRPWVTHTACLEFKLIRLVKMALSFENLRAEKQAVEAYRIMRYRGSHINCEILATCSSTYSPVRTSQEAHSFSIK